MDGKMPSDIAIAAALTLERYGADEKIWGELANATVKVTPEELRELWERGAREARLPRVPAQVRALVRAAAAQDP
jgi:hypothetical protein